MLSLTIVLISIACVSTFKLTRPCCYSMKYEAEVRTSILSNSKNNLYTIVNYK